jgi:EpsI family protein
MRDAYPPSIRIAVVAASLLAGWVYLGTVSEAEEVPPRVPLAELPADMDRWVGRPEPPLDDEIVAILGVDEYVFRKYYRQGTLPIGLYIGYHATQRQGDTLHSPLNCLPGAGWQPLEQSRIVIPVQAANGAGPAGIEVNRVVIGKGLDRELVLYWYQSHRRVVASEYWGKIYTVLDAIRYNRTDAALVRLTTYINEDDRSAQLAEQRAVSFAQSLFPHLVRHLP